MKKRILCLTLGLMLTISQAVPAGAASRKDQLKQDKAAAQSQLAAQESKINNLEDQKQTLSAEIDQLDSDLVNIMVEIEILDGELSMIKKRRSSRPKQIWQWQKKINRNSMKP